MGTKSSNEGTSDMAPESMELKILDRRTNRPPCGCSDASIKLANEDVLDAVSCFYIDPYEQMLAFSVSKFWIGRVF